MKWSEQYRLKERVHQQYPTVWDLKIVRKRLPLILEHLRDGESVLEIGAFHREMEGRLKSRYPGIRYRSMDIDPTFPHDYASMEAIRESFDMVLLFEVIEHLDLKEGGEMVHKIYEILNPGGRVILTTPNVYTPGQYWKDLTHRVAYHHEEQGGPAARARLRALGDLPALQRTEGDLLGEEISSLDPLSNPGH